jgi:curved DNA-binding protein CbpA
MSQAPLNRLAAIKDDGFIDFYELLALEPDATLTRLRTTINALYNESQANRDHRNLNRRREYQTILQVLPQAREFLLDEKKREKYDAYRDDLERGGAVTPFEDWVNAQKEAEDTARADRSAVLGVQDEESDGVPRATVIKAPQPQRPKSRVAVGGDAPVQHQKTARDSLIGSAISIIVFFVLLLGVFVAVKDITIALMVGAIGGIITWIITH